MIPTVSPHPLEDDLANFALPENSRKVVDASGHTIAKTDPNDLALFNERNQALDVLANWRAAHAWPLNAIQNTLRRRAKNMTGVLFAQRQKRLRSIEAKLNRQPYLKLSKMQDVGGCRAVFETMKQLQAVNAIYAADSENTRLVSRPIKPPNDYLNNPKGDGYRGVHYVYQYHPRRKEYEIFDGMRIEIQLRTVLQHSWATALETVSTFLNMGLKWGKGDSAWLRFFQLAASSMAFSEGCPIVPGTPPDHGELIGELRRHSKGLSVVDFLAGLRVSLQRIPKTDAPGTTYLLMLDSQKRMVSPRAFGPHERKRAEGIYSDLEKQFQGKPNIDVVLVQVGSVNDLRKAFPNYYADTELFLTYLIRTLGEDY